MKSNNFQDFFGKKAYSNRKVGRKYWPRCHMPVATVQYSRTQCSTNAASTVCVEADYGS
jgi:hypothetical protein